MSKKLVVRPVLLILANSLPSQVWIKVKESSHNQGAASTCDCDSCNTGLISVPVTPRSNTRFMLQV